MGRGGQDGITGESASLLAHAHHRIALDDQHGRDLDQGARDHGALGHEQGSDVLAGMQHVVGADRDLRRLQNAVLELQQARQISVVNRRDRLAVKRNISHRSPS